MKNFFSNPIFCLFGLFISSLILASFGEVFSYSSPNLNFYNKIGEFVGYWFFPSIPFFIFLFLSWESMNRNNEGNTKEIIFRGKKIDISEKDTVEVNFMGKKINVSKKSPLLKDKYIKNEENDIEEKLEKIEKLYKKKILSSKEREKMRNKILGID